jgi:hypothetical protein
MRDPLASAGHVSPVERIPTAATQAFGGSRSSGCSPYTTIPPPLPGFNRGGSHTFSLGPTAIKTRAGVVSDPRLAPQAAQFMLNFGLLDQFNIFQNIIGGGISLGRGALQQHS